MTAIRNILLHVDRDDGNDARRTLAMALAERFDARLIGLFAYLGPTSIYSRGVIAQRILNEYVAVMEDAAAELRAGFERAANGAGLSCEWRVAVERGHAPLAVHARYADLVVVGQKDPAERFDDQLHNLAEEVVMTAGAPSLVVPVAGSFNGIGECVLVAWNGSRESSRAVRDAWPLLESAREVTVICVNPEPDHIEGAEIAAHLSRHGVNAGIRHTTADDIETADAILNAVSDTGADMLVMGAYGHGRFREFILGGVSRSVMRHMTVPTLLAH